MNKLILIGNGFDLAHGLKTDYNSFIKWFVTKCFREATFEVSALSSTYFLSDI